MKKLVQKCLLFGMLISLCLLFNVEADATELKEVADVKLQLPTDAGGLTYEEFKNSMTILSEDVTIPTPEQAPSGWFGIYDESTGAWAHTIEDGKTYTMDIYLSPAEGYKFGEKVKNCLLNEVGYSTDLWVPEFGQPYVPRHNVEFTLSEKFIYISVRHYKIDEWIESAEFDIPNYKDGAQANFDMVTTSTGNIQIKGGCLVDIAKNPILDEIKLHTQYTIMFAIKPDKEYSISQLKKENIKVMGEEPEKIYKGDKDSYIIECNLDILHEGGTANCQSAKVCEVCRESYGKKDPNNHSGAAEIINQKSSTCVEEGYTGDIYCCHCDVLICQGIATPVSQEHSYDAGVITTTPTETSVGVKTYTCQVCQATKTEELPKLVSKDISQGDTSKGEGNKGENSKDNTAKEDNNGDAPVKVDIPSENTQLTDSKTGMKYRVSKAGESGGSVEFLAPANKKMKQITIPETVKIGGITYKVTSIAKNAFKGCKNLKKVVIGKNITNIGSKAFYGCKNLKTITIKTTKLKSSKVGKKAFTGTSKKAQVTVPKKAYKNYKKFLYKKGIYKKAKIKKAKK